MTDSPASVATKRAHLVAVLGAKGGVGTSLLTANFAALGARDGATCLVDLDLGKGDLATYVDLPPGSALEQLLGRLDELDETFFRQALRRHASGLGVLLQPDGLDELRKLDGDDVRALLGVARRMHDVTWVDAGSRVEVAALATALLADVVVVVATPDIPALRDARRMLALLDRLGVPTERIRLLVNKVDRHGLPVAEIEHQLGVSVAGTVARDDGACRLADAEGSLIPVRSPRSPVARDLATLAQRWSP